MVAWRPAALATARRGLLGVLAALGLQAAAAELPYPAGMAPAYGYPAGASYYDDAPHVEEEEDLSIAGSAGAEDSQGSGPSRRRSPPTGGNPSGAPPEPPAAPPGKDATGPLIPNATSDSSWIGGWGFGYLSWENLGNHTWSWRAEGMGGWAQSFEALKGAFSTHQESGWFYTDGGWILFMADSLGVRCFGAAWPIVGWTVISMGVTGTLALTAHSLQTIFAPCAWACWVIRACIGLGRACCCCKRRTPGEAEVERLLPPALPQPTTVVWTGPATGPSTTTSFFQKSIKQRGTGRKPNDLLVKLDGHVARLNMILDEPEGIKKAGIWIEYGKVKGASHRTLRARLEQGRWIHLCRGSSCVKTDGKIHCMEYAALDAAAIVDIGAHARLTPCRVCVLLWRFVTFGVRLVTTILAYLAHLTFCCGRCSRRQRRRRTATGDAVPGVERSFASLLDQESESEVETEERQCEAVKIGVLIKGEMRPLAPGGCRDAADSTPTTLLWEDGQASDLPPLVDGKNPTACICEHHRQVYQSTRLKDKCSILVCYRQAVSTSAGVPLCLIHLGGEASRAAAFPTVQPPPENSMFAGLRRRIRGRSPNVSIKVQQPGPGFTTPPRRGSPAPAGGLQAVRFESPKVPMPLPSPDDLALDDLRAGDLKHMLVRARVNFTSGAQWIIFLCVRKDPDAVCLDGPWAGVADGPEGTSLEFTLKADEIQPHPKISDAGRLPQGFLEELLHHAPAGAQEMGIAVVGTALPELVWEKLRIWQGRPIGGKLRSLRSWQWNLIRIRGSTIINWHPSGAASATGDLPSGEKEELEATTEGLNTHWKRLDKSASPRAPSKGSRRDSSSGTSQRQPSPRGGRRGKPASEEGGAPDSETEDPTQGEAMLSVYLEAAGHGSDDADAVQCVASGFDEEVSVVLSRLSRYATHLADNATEDSEKEAYQAHALRWKQRLTELQAAELAAAPAARSLAAAGLLRLEARSPAPRSEPGDGQTAAPPATAPLAPPAERPPGLGSPSGMRFTAVAAAPGTLPSVTGAASLFANRGSYASTGLVSFPGLPDRQCAVGANEDPPMVQACTRAMQQHQEQTAEAHQQLLYVIQEGLRGRDDDKVAQLGTLAAIHRGEELDVYLTRGCDTTSVEICAGLTGRELFHGMRRACEHSKHLMLAVKCPTTISNRIAWGTAALAWGGKDHLELPSWSLSVADFPLCRGEDFDNYSMPADVKLEPRPRHPVVFSQWYRQAENAITLWCLLYGREHGRERYAALESLRRSHEHDEDEYPARYVYAIWEELNAAWCEQLREKRRRLCLLLGKQSPRKEDLKLCALAPTGPNQEASFKFPNVFDLDDPSGYYMMVCMPRNERKLKKIFNRSLHSQTPGKAQGHVGGADEFTAMAGGLLPGAYPSPSEPFDKAGAGKRPPAKTKVPPKGGQPSKKLYPAGKKLSPGEVSRSVQHAPRNRAGKILCWDACTWAGCSKTSQTCAHAHEAIKGTSGLDWTIQAQMIKRGGLKSGTRIDPKDVDGRVQQLRSQAQSEEESKRAGAAQAGQASGEPARPRAKAGAAAKKEGCAGPPPEWSAPAAYDEIQCTALEDELREAVQGPDPSWLGDAHANSPWVYGAGESSHPEAIKRKVLIDEVTSSGLLEPLQCDSEYLRSHVLARLTQARAEGQLLEQGTVEQVLLEATRDGGPMLTEEAGAALDRLGAKAGSLGAEADVAISPANWDAEREIGSGTIRVLGQEWGYLDYQDRLPLDAELATRLGVPADTDETRQCLVLHLAAALLAKPGRDPTIHEARDLALKLRRSLWDQAMSAEAALGDAPPFVSPREAELRMCCHDALHPHHDKDFRCTTLFALPELEDVTLRVWRVNHWNQLGLDALLPQKVGKREIHVLIHRGHMRMLRPPAGTDSRRAIGEVIKAWALAGKELRERLTTGWEQYLETEDAAGPVLPSKPPPCAHCRRQQIALQDSIREKAGGAEPPETEDVEDFSQLKPLLRRPSFAWGVRTRELFAGTGRWSSAMAAAGFPAAESVELFEQPLSQTGRREDHDVLRAQVRERILLDAGAAPGPEEANIWQLGPPCTTHSAWNITNGGTRTFAEPDGDGTDPEEVAANVCTDFAADVCERLDENDREWALESSCRDGRYPKIWDRKRIQLLIKRTGAKLITIAMCEWGLSPPDQPDKRYRKLTMWLVSKGLYPWALALARRCSGHHEHVPLDGPLPYEVSDEQAAAFNKSKGGKYNCALTVSESRRLGSLLNRIRLAGAVAQGLGNDKIWKEPQLGAELLRPLNDMIYKLAPDNFHWTLVEFHDDGHKPAALPPGQQALFFGYDAETNLRVTFGTRAPWLHQGARAISGAPAPLSAQTRGDLEALGFRAGLRGMRRTRHAGQYTPRLCAAWACVAKAAAQGSPPSTLQTKLEALSREANAGMEAARAGESLAEDAPRLEGRWHSDAIQHYVTTPHLFDSATVEVQQEPGSKGWGDPHSKGEGRETTWVGDSEAMEEPSSKGDGDRTICGEDQEEAEEDLLDTEVVGEKVGATQAQEAMPPGVVELGKRGGKRGGWKRNKPQRDDAEQGQRVRLRPGPGGGGGDGGDDPDGDEDEDDEEEEEPERPKKSRDEEQDGSLTNPARVFLPQRGDRWMDIRTTPTDAGDLKLVLTTSRWLRTDVIRDKRMHLFFYTEDEESAGAEGPPLADDCRILEGDRLVLWLSTDDPEDFVRWAPRWLHSRGNASGAVLGAPRLQDGEEGQDRQRSVVLRMSDRAVSQSVGRPWMGKFSRAVMAAASRAESTPPRMGETPPSTGPSSSEDSVRLVQIRQELASARARDDADEEATKRAVRVLEIRMNEMAARRATRREHGGAAAEGEASTGRRRKRRSSSPGRASSEGPPAGRKARRARDEKARASGETEPPAPGGARRAASAGSPGQPPAPRRAERATGSAGAVLTPSWETDPPDVSIIMEGEDDCYRGEDMLNQYAIQILNGNRTGDHVRAEARQLLQQGIEKISIGMPQHTSPIVREQECILKDHFEVLGKLEAAMGIPSDERTAMPVRPGIPKHRRDYYAESISDESSPGPPGDHPGARAATTPRQRGRSRSPNSRPGPSSGRPGPSRSAWMSLFQPSARPSSAQAARAPPPPEAYGRSDDDDARVGGPPLSPLPEEGSDEAPRRNTGEAEAEEYVAWCTGEDAKEYSPAKVREAVKRGDRLLRATGSVEKAAELMKTVREKRCGNPLSGTLEPELQAALEPEHAQYLRSMAVDGVPTRRSNPRVRTVHRSHASAVDHAAEMYEKAWKDSRFGVVLWASESSQDVLESSTVIESPSGRVPKQNPDRTLSAEGRPIHDMRGANLDSRKEQHPPAKQPLHRGLARLSLWWEARHPGVPQLCSKRDVARAFKWHHLEPGAVPEFGTSLPGDAVGLEGRVVMIHTVLVFGWSGSPGEYMAFSWAAKREHERRRPPQPSINDTVSYSSKWLMDDGVVLEPVVGLRPWLSGAELDLAMTRVWGPQAVNEDKLALEGEFVPEQLVWGLYMHFGKKTTRLPEQKCIKAQYLLALPELAHGCRRVPVKLVQELRGTAQHWSSAQPAIRPELPVLDKLLGSVSEGSAWAEPKGDQDAKDAAWEEWDRTLELFRVMFDAPEAWSTTFQAGFSQALTPRELMALPGVACRTRWTGGDATLGAIGAVDWGRAEGDSAAHMPTYMATEAKPLLEQLSDAIVGPSTEGDWIISVVELLALVALAAGRGHLWAGELVFYVTDNANVKSWLTKRRPKNALARHLLRVIERLEAEHGFMITSFYVRTYHNEVADWLTREEVKKVHSVLARAGWHRMEPPAAWGEIAADAHDRLLRIPGETGPLAEAALRHRALRRPANPQASRPLVGQAGLELGGLLQGYRDAFLKLGGSEVADGQRAAWIMTSLTMDPRGFEVEVLLTRVGQDKPTTVVVDMPTGHSTVKLEKALKQLGYTLITLDLLCSEHGDATSRTRKVVVAGRGPAVQSLASIRMPPACRTAHGVKHFLERDLAEGWLDDQGEVLLDPKIRSTGNPLLPKPAGHITIGGTKHLLHSPDGPAGTARWPGQEPTGPGATLLYIPGGTQGRVRALTPIEVWRIHGGSNEAWEAFRAEGKSDEDLLRAAARALPPESAQTLLRIVSEALEGGAAKVGVCHDPEEQAAWEATRRWFRAWAISPNDPAGELLRQDREGVGGALSDDIHKNRKRSQAVRFKQINEDTILGPLIPPAAGELELDKVAPRTRSPRGAKPRRGKAVPETDLVRPLALGQGRDSLPDVPAHPTLGGERYGAWLKDQRTELMLQKLSEGTRAGYEGGWRQWTAYRTAQGHDPWLQGRDREERMRDEDALIDFVVVLAVILSRTDGTVKQKLFAVRYAHLVVGFGDPLLHRGRLWTTLAGLRRWQGPGNKRKRPVTPRMLLWLKKHIHQDAGLSDPDAATLFAAVMVAFFFLLRASEYLVTNKTWSLERVTHGEDVEARAGGERVSSFAGADECVLHIKGSKTDQYNVGTVRNQYATEAPLCVVNALAAMQSHLPQRFNGSEERLPLFRWLSGEPVKREEVQHYLVLAGLAAGLRREEIGSHSLRIGGATAMYHVTDDLAKVQRYGRWASDSFHSYLWESHEPQRDVARRMANDMSELTTPAARPQEGAAGNSARRAPPRGLSALGTAAAAAATLGRAAAAGQELATLEEDQRSISMYLVEGSWDIHITIPLEVAAKIIVSLMVVLATALALAWCCCSGAKPSQQDPCPQEAVEGKRKLPKKPKTIYCDAGVMGPVHYNGVRYVHATQGFRRADEVTREVASQGQGPPAFHYYPSAPSGGTQPEPQKAHHE